LCCIRLDYFTSAAIGVVVECKYPHQLHFSMDKPLRAKIIFASIFIVGPSPRSLRPSLRKRAIPEPILHLTLTFDFTGSGVEKSASASNVVNKHRKLVGAPLTTTAPTTPICAFSPSTVTTPGESRSKTTYSIQMNLDGSRRMRERPFGIIFLS
jgi:hypothetical protein